VYTGGVQCPHYLLFYGKQLIDTQNPLYNLREKEIENVIVYISDVIEKERYSENMMC